jgi:hypothetical protein
VTAAGELHRARRRRLNDRLWRLGFKVDSRHFSTCRVGLEPTAECTCGRIGPAMRRQRLVIR